jgi:hypothetical protein
MADQEQTNAQEQKANLAWLGQRHVRLKNIQSPHPIPRNKREEMLPGKESPTVNQVGTSDGKIFN